MNLRTCPCIMASASCFTSWSQPNITLPCGIWYADWFSGVFSQLRVPFYHWPRNSHDEVMGLLLSERSVWCPAVVLSLAQIPDSQEFISVKLFIRPGSLIRTLKGSPPVGAFRVFTALKQRLSALVYHSAASTRGNFHMSLSQHLSYPQSSS
jgi:hypothetical protein